MIFCDSSVEQGNAICYVSPVLRNKLIFSKHGTQQCLCWTRGELILLFQTGGHAKFLLLSSPHEACGLTLTEFDSHTVTNIK